MTTTAVPGPPPAVQRVAERAVAGDVPFFTHSHWSEFDAWLVHGITGRAADMSLFGDARSADVLRRWRRLRDALGADVIVHARQVHRADVLVHRQLPAGILIAPDADGHATSRVAAVLAVSVADCIPLHLVAPDVRAVALLHAGWRGVAAGILERGVHTMQSSFRADVAELRLHGGPAICGDCYEVGPEVAAQLGLAPATHVDLRAVVAQRAVALGLRASNITISTHCTRCDGSPFFSHRGGCVERQIAVMGIRTHS